MQFRNPFFLENLYRDQPYCSLLLVAPFCDGACPGCQNQSLSAESVADFSVNELVTEYTNNPFIDGITVAGLEICLSGDAFINDLIEFITKAKISKITIYSRYSIKDPKLKSILDTIQSLPFVTELYCKSGAYAVSSNTKTVTLVGKNDPQNTWNINLASANQQFHILKGDCWQVFGFNVE